MSVEPYSTPGEGRVQNHDPQWLTLDDIGINEQKVIPDEAVSLFSWFLGLLLSAVPAAQAATAVAMDQIVSGAFGNTHIVEYNFTAPYGNYVNAYIGNYCGRCDYGLPVYGNGVDVTYDKAGLGGAELISTYWLNPGTYTAEGIEYQGLNWGYQFRWMTYTANLAKSIKNNANITLLTYHVGGLGVGDGATASDNINSTAQGLFAKRSSYTDADGTAPGGTTLLQSTMLNGLLQLGNGNTFRVTEIAGGSHGATSAHYTGRAIDVDYVNSLKINGISAKATSFRNACIAQGAISSRTYGPDYDPYGGHQTHIHCQWP